MPLTFDGGRRLCPSTSMVQVDPGRSPAFPQPGVLSTHEARYRSGFCRSVPRLHPEFQDQAGEPGGWVQRLPVLPRASDNLPGPFRGLAEISVPLRSVSGAFYRGHQAFPGAPRASTSLISTKRLLGLLDLFQPLRTFSVHKWKGVVVDQDGPNWV